MLDAQVIIVGGGPVGSVLAMLLGRAGVRTLILERTSFPRDKPCGEGLMPGGVAVLERLGFDLAREGFQPLAGIAYRTLDGGAAFGAFRPAHELPDHGFGVRRLRFDALLAEGAASTPNVELKTSCAVPSGPVSIAGGSWSHPLGLHRASVRVFSPTSVIALSLPSLFARARVFPLFPQRTW